MRYRKHPIEVDAIQWLPEKMAPVDVEKAFGGSIGNVERKGQRLTIYSTDRFITVKPGEWIVRGSDGQIGVYTDEAFRANHEEVK